MSELYHHGIKGQEHGVKNGPPYPLAPEDHTPEQIKQNPDIRRKIKVQKANLRVEKHKARLEKSALKALKKGNDEKLRAKASTMSDEELDKRVKRLNLEKQYISLEKDLNPAKKQRESVIKTMLGSALKNIGTQAVTAIVGEAWNKLVEQRDRPELKVNPKKGQKDK